MCKRECGEAVELCRRECGGRVEEVTGAVVSRDLQLQAAQDQLDHLRSIEGHLNRELERYTHTHVICNC